MSCLQHGQQHLEPLTGLHRMQNISRHYYHLAGRFVHLLVADGEFCLLVWDGTEPVVLINVCLDVSDDSTKAR